MFVRLLHYFRIRLSFELLAADVVNKINVTTNRRRRERVNPEQEVGPLKKLPREASSGSKRALVQTWRRPCECHVTLLIGCIWSFLGTASREFMLTGK